jgi:hypothetical protein
MAHIKSMKIQALVIRRIVEINDIKSSLKLKIYNITLKMQSFHVCSECEYNDENDDEIICAHRKEKLQLITQLEKQIKELEEENAEIITYIHNF